MKPPSEKRSLPLTDLFGAKAGTSVQRGRAIRSQKKSTWQIFLIFMGIIISSSGIFAAVAIAIRGNTGGDGTVSFGVGKAAAETCDTNFVRTDTTSTWFDNQDNFMIGRVDVSNVANTCAGKTMTLVMNYSTTDQSYTCILPATSAAFNDTTFSLATFIFVSSSITTNSILQQVCVTNLTLTTSSLLSGTAVQIL